MKVSLKFILIFILYFAYSNQAISKEKIKLYNYANNDAEYSVGLPEAPHVETIWADSKDYDIPYLDTPPESGYIGEIATFKRIDIETEDSFEVKITFLKADKPFLKSLNEEKIKKLIDNDFKDTPLENKSFKYVLDKKNNLQRGSVSGFFVNRDNEPYYYTEHFFTGLESISVVKIVYSIENKTFDNYYKEIINNINYIPL